MRFIDLQKACDSVDRVVLQCKVLARFGVPRKMVAATVDVELSEWIEVTHEGICCSLDVVRCMLRRSSAHRISTLWFGRGSPSRPRTY